jgi:hypothetical protein
MPIYVFPHIGFLLDVKPRIHQSEFRTYIKVVNELVVLHLKDAESSFCTGELITVNYCHTIICTRHNSASSVPLSEKGEQQIYTRFVECGFTHKFVVQPFDCKTKGHLNVTPGEVSLDLNGTTNQKRGSIKDKKKYHTVRTD